MRFGTYYEAVLGVIFVIGRERDLSLARSAVMSWAPGRVVHSLLLDLLLQVSNIIKQELSPSHLSSIKAKQPEDSILFLWLCRAVIKLLQLSN